jgi:hypothetical protein
MRATAVCLLAIIFMTSSGVASPQDEQRARAWWPSPDLQVFGHAGVKTICVYVVGSVKRPGVYHLESGSTVADALKAAQGVSDAADWEHFCGLVRQRPLDVPQIYRFKYRQDDEQMSLRDGDQIYIGHETY